MPVVSSYAFVNNRGGTGKSFCLFQIATAYAKANPDKKVLVLDCSAHGDVSQYLLGGTQEPFEREPPASTAGAQVKNSIPVEQTMVGLLLALLRDDTSQSSIVEMMARLFRHRECVDVRDHTVKVAEYSQDMQNIPENLFLCAGGKELAMGGTSRILFEDEDSGTQESLARLSAEKDWIQLGKLLNNALGRVEEDWVAFFDTDAEIRERGPSLVAIVAAEKLVTVVTDNWVDYLRVFGDPVNALLPTLRMLTRGAKIGTIQLVLFNKMEKHRQMPSILLDMNGRESASIPFSPVQSCKKHMEEISEHFYTRCWGGVNNEYRGLFSQSGEVQSQRSFIKAYVAAVYNFPAVPVQITTVFGIPFACIDPNKQYKSSCGDLSIGPVGTDTLRVIQETIHAVVQRL